MSSNVLVWLREDLRLDDNPALSAAGSRSALFVYVWDEASPGLRALGGASRWWLAHSLEALAEDLAARGGRLDIVRGAAERLIPALASAAGVSEAFWSRRYEGAAIEIDKRVKAALAADGVKAESFNGRLLREPWQVRTDGGTPFKVFSPYWRRSRGLGPFDPPVPAPERLLAADWPAEATPRLDLSALGLTPSTPDWSGGLKALWRPGERGAQDRLAAFVEEALRDYADRRDFLSGAPTSLLAPHLRFGEISPRRIVSFVEDAAHRGAASPRAVEKFLSEIGWREFAYSLLFASPDLARSPWQTRFAAFPWREDEPAFRAWRRGQTGYPVVDAGMRELWATGYMHNRARMIVASFLVKHLLIDWRRGEEWFWDTLCDADSANNAASWQWVAGSGADAAPYFRIFNPMLQGERFDPDGAYVRRWIPELARLDTRYIHAPWTAPSSELMRAGISLGGSYPRPIVDHDFARKRALDALASLNG